MQIKKSGQLLVGSTPLQSALKVFTTTTKYFKDNLDFMPDGEFDDRIWWHNYLARYVESPPRGGCRIGR